MPQPSFKCPMCGYTTYAVVQIKRPDGHRRETQLFECARCSVVFHDPIAFTQGKEREWPKIINRPRGRISEENSE